MNTIEQLINASTINDASVYSSIDLELTSAADSKSLTHYVTSPIHENGKSNVEKIMAAAMQIASEAGIIGIPASSPLQSAITAVNIGQSLNVSYLVDKGEMAIHEAAELLIDQAAANVAVVAEVALSPGPLQLGMNVALDVIGAAFPPAIPAAQFAKQFTGPIASFISEKAKPIVKNGIKAVSSAVKTVVHGVISKVASTVKTTATKLAKKLFSFA